MRCEQARQLFDAYLDGELSPTLATELGAHRVQCSECRRALALLEVSGHIIASDREPVRVGGEFSDRLLACMELRPGRWTLRTRRMLYIGGPLAAAAVVALAFLGVFDRRSELVLGIQEQGIAKPVDSSNPLENEDFFGQQPVSSTDDQAERALDEWIQQARENMASKRQSVESLHEMLELDLTILQRLDMLDQANEASTNDERLPTADLPSQSPPPEATPPTDEDSEDL